MTLNSCHVLGTKLMCTAIRHPHSSMPFQSHASFVVAGLWKGLLGLHSSPSPTAFGSSPSPLECRAVGTHAQVARIPGQEPFLWHHLDTTSKAVLLPLQKRRSIFFYLFSRLLFCSVFCLLPSPPFRVHCCLVLWSNIIL